MTLNFVGSISLYKPTEDDQEKSKVREESDSTIPDSSRQTVTSTPPVIAPFTDVSSLTSLLSTSSPINTEATTITTSLLEITPFIALQLRVARLEQEMSEVKKTDHSADVLASTRSQTQKGTSEEKQDSLTPPGASGSAQPPTKDDEQSSRKPRESDASASKQHPALTSSGWQITDTRDLVLTLRSHRTDPQSRTFEQSSMTFHCQDEGNGSDNGGQPTTLTFQRRSSFKGRLDIGSSFNGSATTGKKKLCKADLEGPAFNLVKAFHKNIIFLQYQMDECHKLLTIKDILKMEMEMEIPSVKASANSDVMYSFSSAQDGDPLQDDVRLCLGDDLKKAQDHSQRQA
ncbi:hypothetical protein Tco_0448760 [Tanacetum coccineum]